MATYIEPFDFKEVFINYFLGGTQLFAFAFVIIYSYVAARYNFSNTIYLVLLVLISLLFAGILGEAIYILILLIVGFFSFKLIARIIT